MEKYIILHQHIMENGMLKIAYIKYYLALYKQMALYWFMSDLRLRGKVSDKTTISPFMSSNVDMNNDLYEHWLKKIKDGKIDYNDFISNFSENINIGNCAFLEPYSFIGKYSEGMYLRFVLCKNNFSEQYFTIEQVVEYIILKFKLISEHVEYSLKINNILMNGSSAKVNYAEEMAKIYGEDELNKMSYHIDDDELTINTQYILDNSDNIKIDIFFNKERLSSYILCIYESKNNYLNIGGYDIISSYCLPVKMTFRKNDDCVRTPIYKKRYLTHGVIYGTPENVYHITVKTENGDFYEDYNIYKHSDMIIFSLIDSPLNNMELMNYDIDNMPNPKTITEVSIDGIVYPFKELCYEKMNNYEEIEL